MPTAGTDLAFFDANAFIGRPATGIPSPAPTAGDLLAEMDHNGIDRALVWHVAQLDYAPTIGNRMLADEIAPHDRLIGCWTLLPCSLPEFPKPDELIASMKDARVRALRVFPERHRYLLRREVFGPVLDVMLQRRIPLILSVERGNPWQAIYDLLERMPELVCIVSDYGCWGADRWFRPLLDHYEHVYVDLADYLLDGGIEALVADYGASKLLYGSGFPIQYPGGMMMAIRHAEIGEEDKQAITSGNLDRVLGEVRL
ncbi:MAG: amidohydrolase family protein [Phycisphaerae bacterium]|nr:amidohydrolase family protein [Phycisphaerae bacterium]